ncbi:MULTISPECIES: hypothetical protein [Pseudomonas]|uniref:hypothetical protein n=1 Tax=Pseudomonas TaxID=286 RepID=UPI0011AFDA5D|nr:MULTISPECIES: hypothetical protein [Pseudomonas]
MLAPGKPAHHNKPALATGVVHGYESGRTSWGRILRYLSSSARLGAAATGRFVDWHGACKTFGNPPRSTTIDRPTQVMGKSGKTAQEQAKTPGTARFQAFFFAFFKTVMSFVGC